MRLGDLLKAKGNLTVSPPSTPESQGTQTIQIPIEGLKLNPFQPRTNIKEDSIQELADSIRLHGLLQPVVVRPTSQGYQLLVGERRLRACQKLGWNSIPAVIKEVNDTQAAAIAIVENLQREEIDLFDEIEAIFSLCEVHGLTQKDVATILGLSQSAVANKLRLKKLPAKVKEIISREMLTERHARVLLALENEEEQIKAASKFASERMSVKQAEEYVLSKIRDKRKRNKKIKPIGIYDLRKNIKKLVTKVQNTGMEVDMKENIGDNEIEINIRIKY
jgi:ParB family chromosome partitioning protein